MHPDYCGEESLTATQANTQRKLSTIEEELARVKDMLSHQGDKISDIDNVLNIGSIAGVPKEPCAGSKSPTDNSRLDVILMKIREIADNVETNIERLNNIDRNL